MNEELQLNLQAYADGELSEREARDIADLLAKDGDARALLAELKNTRCALAGFESEIQLPESREFYWSKIEREIRRLETADPPRAGSSLFASWRKFLLPSAAVAVLVIAGMLIFPRPQDPGPRAATVARSAQSEFALADSEAFTYRDYANGTTLVWLSYPPENEFAERNTEDTLD